MDLRRMTRVEGGFPCKILDGLKRHQGTVTNLAVDGLFVQIQDTIPHGSQVKIHIPEAKDVPEMTVRAIVVRQRLVPDCASRLSSEGVGLRVLQAPDVYYELVEREEEAADEADTPPDPSLRSFRVRVSETGGSTFRVLSVAAASAEAAREEIQYELGSDWEVTDVLHE